MKNNETVNPFGYGKLNWNDSIDKLKSIYPDVVEVELQKGERITMDVGIKKYSLEIIHLDKKKLFKYFYLKNNKLFEVKIDYGILNVHHALLLNMKLEDIYGEFDWIGLGRKDNIENHCYFNIFSEYLSITLVNEFIFEKYGGCKNKNVYCVYKNRKYDEDIGKDIEDELIKKYGTSIIGGEKDIDKSDYPKIAL